MGFAGGDYTTTVEAFIPTNGRGVQGATSHHLGQNFSKMFNIEFEDHEGGKKFVYQNSWGITTRTIGVMIMVHGDNNGLVMPPRVAPIQVVVVPIQFKKNLEELDAKAAEVCEQLKAAGVRAHLDNRTGYKPGFKYSHWEMRGVPLRIEIGPRDLEAGQVVVARRDDLRKEAKVTVPMAEISTRIPELLEDVQQNLLTKAKAKMDAQITDVTTWPEFVPALNQKNICRVPWCLELACENNIKKKSGEESTQMESASGLTGAAKSLCIPFEQPELAEGANCFNCEAEAKKWALFGRSY